MYLLIAYDISDDKRRRAVEKILSSYGNRVNYSVFEVTVSKADYPKLICELEDSSCKQDHIRIYRLNKDSIKKSLVLHTKKGVFEDEALYI